MFINVIVTLFTSFPIDVRLSESIHQKENATENIKNKLHVIQKCRTKLEQKDQEFSKKETLETKILILS